MARIRSCMQVMGQTRSEEMRRTGYLEKPVTMSLREGGGRTCLTEERGAII